MSGWHEFEGTIEPMEWGDSVYTVLPIPRETGDALTAEGARRVEGEIAETPVNLALTKAPVIDGLFLYTGKSFLSQSGIKPGERFTVRLRKADPNEVDTPADVAAALLAHGALSAWEDLTSGKRRGLLHAVTSATRPETRKRRIGALVLELSGNDA